MPRHADVDATDHDGPPAPGSPGRPARRQRPRAGGRPRRTLFVVAVGAIALLAGACTANGDDGEASSGGDAGRSTTTSAAPERGDEAAFAERGPYAVGVTELDLDGRPVTVWYPARRAGDAEGSYSQLEALPPALAQAAPALLPEDLDPSVLTVTMPGTYADAEPSPEGPFPLVLFSHGFGSFRKDASHLVAGLASWGFVVAAPEHTERDRAALVGQQVVRDPGRDVEVLLGTVGLVAGAGGVLEGLADADRVGAVGHSAGGRAVLDALSADEVDVAVGWAAAGRTGGPPSEKPSMNVAARVDVLVPIEEVEDTYEGLAPPKRLVVVEGAGHNSFTDLCLAVRAGNDLFGLAERVGLQIPPDLVAGGRDGCEPDSLDTRAGWEVVQHFTVAQLRAALGVDRTPVGLDDAVAGAFDAEVEYRSDT